MIIYSQQAQLTHVCQKVLRSGDPVGRLNFYVIVQPDYYEVANILIQNQLGLKFDKTIKELLLDGPNAPDKPYIRMYAKKL